LTGLQHFVQAAIDIGVILGILVVGGIVKLVIFIVKDEQKARYIEDCEYRYHFQPHWWRAAPTKDQIDRWQERERNGDVAPSERRRLLRRRRIRKIFALGKESKPDLRR
jgi:hypothetical protein